MRFPLFVGVYALTLSLFAQTPLRVRFDPASGNVTVRARNVPLSTILARLAAEGAEVIAPGVEERAVTISVENRPLREVLRQILPEGTRFRIRGLSEKVLTPGSTGAKPGRLTQRPAGLPEKDTNAKLPPINADGGRKPPAENQFPQTVRVPGMKAPPAADTTSGTPHPKVPRRMETTGRYLRIHLTMTETAVTIDRLRILPSELVADRQLLGDHVWAFEAPGETIAVGSIRDPLDRHSYPSGSNAPHEVLQAKSGDFHVSLPEAVLDRNLLPTSRLVIYEIVGTPPASELTPATFSRFRAALRERYSVRGSDIQRRLDGPR